MVLGWFTDIVVGYADSFPGCTAGGCLKGFAPGNVHAAGFLGHLLDLSTSDSIVENLEEVVCEAGFLVVEGLLARYEGFLLLDFGFLLCRFTGRFWLSALHIAAPRDDVE